MMYAKQMRIEFQYTDESSSNQEALATLKEIEQFSFVKKLSVLPPYVKYLNGKISEQNRIDIGCIIDFPFGILSTENKLDIIKRSIQDGANSIEMVMPSF